MEQEDFLIDIDELDEEEIAQRERLRKKKMRIGLLIVLAAYLILIAITVIKVKSDAKKELNNYGSVNEVAQIILPIDINF